METSANDAGRTACFGVFSNRKGRLRQRASIVNAWREFNAKGIPPTHSMGGAQRSRELNQMLCPGRGCGTPIINAVTKGRRQNGASLNRGRW